MFSPFQEKDRPSFPVVPRRIHPTHSAETANRTDAIHIGRAVVVRIAIAVDISEVR